MTRESINSNNESSNGHAKRRGFTLIELLVVISIISVLSSVVLVALGGAKGKAKDAIVKQEVAQLKNVMQLVFMETGSYESMLHNWIPGLDSGPYTCETYYASVTNVQYRSSAIQICNKITQNAAAPLVSGLQHIQLFSGSGNSTYSIMALLNNGKWYCAGSSGISGEYANYSTEGVVTKPGCWETP